MDQNFFGARTLIDINCKYDEVLDMYEDLFVVLTCNCALILTLVRLHLITPSISVYLKMLPDLPISNLPDLWWLPVQS